VAEALTFLAEGVDVSVLERVWQSGEETLRAWLTRAGLHAVKLHAYFFEGLQFQHIQLDELWANVHEERQEVWVWLAMEATTKIVPVIQLGPRTLEMAYAWCMSCGCGCKWSWHCRRSAAMGCDCTSMP
jgi:hypothetical protein